MFDISFWELAIVGIVALIVIGPERLPGVARTAGHLFGRLQRYVSTVKHDIQREIEASELAKVKQEVHAAARAFEDSVQQHASSINREVQAIESAATAGAPGVQAALPDSVAAPPVASDAAAEASAANPAPIPSSPAAAKLPDSPSPPVAAQAYAQGAFDFGVEPVRRPMGGR